MRKDKDTRPEQESDIEALNIIFLPENEVLVRAITLSQTISKRVPSDIILNTTNQIPHITNLQLMANRHKALQRIAEFARTQEPFPITLDSISIAYNQFIFWNCQFNPNKNSPLKDIHYTTLEIFRDLQMGLTPNVAKFYSDLNLSQKEREHIDKYKAHLVAELYAPHITLAHCNPTNIQEALSLVENLDPIIVNIAKIAVGPLGDFGSVGGIMQEFNLEGAIYN